MKTRKAGLLALLATVVAFAGCASGPAFEEYESQMQAVGDGKGRIYMYRPSSLGAAVKPAIRVNGDAVGTSSAKGFFYVDLPPGDYTIAASTEAKRSLDVTLDAGEEMYVRLEMKPPLRTRLGRAPPDASALACGQAHGSPRSLGNHGKNLLVCCW